MAGAIAIGGPGAVFWMWCSALLGMCTKFSEVTLAVHFRERNANGELVGGPMYYIKNGLAKHWRWLAAIYALFGVLTKYKKGFLAATIGSCVGSAFIGAFGVRLYGYITSSIFSIPAYIGPYFIYAAIGWVIAFGLSFVLSYLFVVKMDRS